MKNRFKLVYGTELEILFGQRILTFSMEPVLPCRELRLACRLSLSESRIEETHYLQWAEDTPRVIENIWFSARRRVENEEQYYASGEVGTKCHITDL